MAYEPTQWKAGDTVTSAKLNKMEQGIAASGGIRVVQLLVSNFGPITLVITPNELINAFRNSEVIIISGVNSEGNTFQSLISDYHYDGTTYFIQVNEDLPIFTFSDPDVTFSYTPESSGDNNPGGGNISL